MNHIQKTISTNDGQVSQPRVPTFNDSIIEHAKSGVSSDVDKDISQVQWLARTETTIHGSGRALGDAPGAALMEARLPMQPGKRLYHFTSIFALPGIVREGISNGEVAVTPVHVVNFPWFTSEFAVEAQTDWVCDSQHKLALRLEVEFHREDECLVRWRDYANQLRVRDDWYRAMTGPRINKNGRDWHVYRGVVPFDRITGAYFFPCRECVTREKLRRAGELVAPVNIAFTPFLPCQHVTEEDALNLTENDRSAGHSQPVIEAFEQVATGSAVLPLKLPQPENFLEYVQNVVDAVRDFSGANVR